jgi:hypothetical protein
MIKNRINPVSKTLPKSIKQPYETDKIIYTEVTIMAEWAITFLSIKK